MDLVKALSSLPDAEAAVIHFTGVVNKNSGWVKIDPDSLAGLNTEIGWKPSYGQPQTTSFAAPFEKARELFSEGDCIRRSVVLLSDGTPEDLNGRLQGAELDNEMTSVRSNVGQLQPLLDGIYLISFKVNAKYLGESLLATWKDFSAAQGNTKAAPFIVIPSEKFAAELQNIIASLSTADLPAALARYQDLSIKIDPDSELRQGPPGEIKFQIVDASGVAVLPGDDSSYRLEFGDISLIQGPQSEPLSGVTQADGVYHLPVTPPLSGQSRLDLQYQLVDAQNTRLLDCSASAELQVSPSAPSSLGNILLSLVITNPPLQAGGPVVLPMQLNYDGDRGWASTLKWDVSAQASPGGESLKASVSTVDASQGVYNLDIQPSGATSIEVHVAAAAVIDDQPVTIPAAKTTLEIPSPSAVVCACSAAWKIWFWPLAILFAAALLVLVLLRSGWTRRNDPRDDPRADAEEAASEYRVRHWRHMFLPVLAIFLFLVLNRLFWCCIIPLWLFPVSLLTLTLIFLPPNLIYRDRESQPRSWWWLLLLLALVLLVAAFINSWWAWLLLALLLVVLGRWYIWTRPLPDRVPDLLPAAEPVRLTLVITPSNVPVHQPVLVPMHLNYVGNKVPAESIDWQISARTAPGGQPLAPTVDTLDTGRGEYRIHIDPQDQPGKIELLVRASALIDGRLVQTSEAPAALEIIPGPRVDDLTQLEGIGPAVNERLQQKGITTFRQLARTGIAQLNTWLAEWGYQRMDPKTWPRQARLADIAYEYESPEDMDKFKSYMAWLKDGIAPDEYSESEKDRRAPDEPEV
jgi:hypothetical protein